MFISKPLTAVLFVVCLAGSVQAIKMMRPEITASTASVNGRVKGSSGARVSIAEYFDYQCGACRMAYQLFEQYEKAFPGSLRVEMRYYPLPGHAHGLKAAIYAECAASQGKFWPFHDQMMAQQQEWVKVPDPLPVFKGYAIAAGVNPDSFDACVADPETEIRVLREKEAGMQLGIKLTPSCLINGKLVVGSNGTSEELKKILGEIPDAQKTHAHSTAH